MTLIGGLRRRLRGPNAEPSPEPTPVAAPHRGPEVEFAAYAEDCRVFGFMRLAADRLTDALNDATEYELTDVMVVRLEDGVGSQTKELTVRRDEVLAVRASGPRGDARRRGRRRPYPVVLKTGPYVIHGYVHGLPGADPLHEIRRRKAMVPMTEAWIEYQSAGTDHRARVGTIIVNRTVYDWIRIAKDEEVRLPNLPAETKPNPMAKDLTGYIRGGE